MSSVDSPVAVGRPVTGARGPASAHGRLRGALRNSFLDGLFTMVMVGLVDPFAVPAILALGAGNMAVAVMSAAAMFLPAVGQLASPRLTVAAASRRTLVVACVRTQALACLFFAGAGFLHGTWAIAAAIAAYAIYAASGAISYGPWAGWMSDLVPKSGRSRYFSMRGLWYGPVGGLTTLGVGCALRALWGGSRVAPWVAFAAMLAVAAASRLSASIFVARQYEPPPREKFPAEDFSYWQFLGKVGESNFANFTVALATFTGAAYLTGPFFTTYVLRDLGYDYLTYTLLQTGAMASGMVFVRFWARVADRYGNMLVIRLCALLIALIPLLYLGGRWLPPLAAGWIVGGAAWSGLGLASFNYVTDVVTPRRRLRCYAYLQATVGIVVAAFMLSFGALVEHLPVLFRFPLQTVFLCSAVLRLLPALAFVFIVREVAAKPEARAIDLFYELPAVRPTADFLRDVARPFTRG